MLYIETNMFIITLWCLLVVGVPFLFSFTLLHVIMNKRVKLESPPCLCGCVFCKYIAPIVGSLSRLGHGVTYFILFKTSVLWSSLTFYYQMWYVHGIHCHLVFRYHDYPICEWTCGRKRRKRHSCSAHGLWPVLVLCPTVSCHFWTIYIPYQTKNDHVIIIALQDVFLLLH